MQSGKLFHTLITLHEKKYTLTLLHLVLYICACGCDAVMNQTTETKTH